ncbi:MAG: hypothetical protein FWF49_04360, partial [Oscillospiraceae bacterium]|nr:hypothetical protein [Oscillospiraceae bacterium]
MRIFKKYTFALLPRVVFKDAWPFLETWLADNGIAYRGVAFSLEGGDAAKLIAAYPFMQKYQNKNAVTSFPVNWPADGAIYVPPEDIPLLRKIAGKLLRNFGMHILLDNVRWFETINAVPAVPGDPVHGYQSHFRLSNFIDINKPFLNVCIEVTATGDTLLDTNPLLQDMASFGDLVGTKTATAFDKEESLLLEAKKEEWNIVWWDINRALGFEEERQRLEAEEKAMFAARMETFKTLGAAEAFAVDVSGLSPKKAIASAIKGTGYRYV